MRRSISRPCSALPMRRTTYSPQYGLGRGRKTVACMSLVSSTGERVERVWPTDSLTDNMRASFLGPDPFRTGPRTNDECRLLNLVEEFLGGLADALQAQDMPHGEIRMGDVPANRRDLVFGNPVLYLGAANAWPAIACREEDVQAVRNRRREVADVGIPLAVVGSGEEQLRVVVQKHEAHIVDGADPVRVAEVAVAQFQQRAQPLGSARREWDDE